MGFRFVHAADLHLGSQFSGVGELDPDLRTRAVNSSMKALENLVEYCLESQVDFVLLAGDVFDSPAPYLRVQKHFVGQVEKLRTAGIEVFMVTGNHDANVFDSFVLPLPDNLHVFSSSQVECISRSYRGQSVTITGISYPQALVEDLSPLFPRPQQGGINIALLHCDIGGQDPGYSPVALADLEALGYHYWAIGHVHSQKQWQSSCLIQYPGILQGRHRAESGSKGFYVITADHGAILASEFVLGHDVVWQNLELDLSQAQKDQLFDKLAEAKEEARAQYPVGTMLELTLTGTSECYGELKKKGVIEDLLAELRQNEAQRADFVWVTELEDQTLPEIDWENLRAQGDFLSEVIGFIEQIEAGIGDIDDEVAAAGENIALSFGIDMDHSEILQKAKLLAVHLFQRGRQAK